MLIQLRKSKKICNFIPYTLAVSLGGFNFGDYRNIQAMNSASSTTTSLLRVRLNYSTSNGCFCYQAVLARSLWLSVYASLTISPETLNEPIYWLEATLLTLQALFSTNFYTNLLIF